MAGRGVHIWAALALYALVMAAPGLPAAAQASPQLAGTVTDSVSGAPIDEAHVAALRTTDFGLAAGATADAAGHFSLTGLGAGTYFLYLLDPTGQHTPGFHGPPTPVTVAATGTVTVDATMSPRTGTIAGAITDATTGAPLAGAWVLAVALSTGRMAGGAFTDGDGSYAIDGLSPGPHLVVALDPSGLHLPRYHDGAPSPVGASPVTVSAGAHTTVDASLVAASSPPPTATLRGTITESGGVAGLGGVWIVALDAATMTMRGGAVTDAQGVYDLALAPGPYVLGFLDPDGGHLMEWFDEQGPATLADATPVDVDGATTIDEQLARTTGAIVGSITEDESNDPVAGAWLLAIGPHDVRIGATTATGSYRVGDLSAGSYRVAAVDPSGRHPVEYADDSATYEGARTIAVGPGSDTHADVGLAPPRCGAAGAPAICLPGFPTPIAGAGWSRYDIATGAHSATVTRGAQATAPKAGFSTASGRRYHFVFDGTARYVLTNPTQPEDQLDWNKLPGLSDCGAIDLSQNGWMFAWRWRTDLSPQRLEITAYANNNGTHLWPNEPMLSLTSAQLDARVPLWFDMGISTDLQRYEFRIAGPGSRSATATLPRQCAGSSTTILKWAAGFYFGGTSTAPTPIRGWINEP